MTESLRFIGKKYANARKRWFGMVITMLLIPFNIFSANLTLPENQDNPTKKRVIPVLPDTIPLSNDPLPAGSEVEEEYITVNGDTVRFTPIDTLRVVDSPNIALFKDSTIVSKAPDAVKIFTPDPIRAVWMSALCPGLGQIYNRRYWKLPIVIGGFLGLGYGASWNNGMLADYTRAYTDLMDNDPSTDSYMDFFPPNTSESSLNRTWLERTLKTRKDYYRRNRDLCIISMIGVYLIAMVDAYVDASLSNFDISPDLSMQVVPALLNDPRSYLPALGFQLAFNF